MSTRKEDLSSLSGGPGLPTAIIGRRVLYFATIASTMDVARQQAQAGAIEGTVVIAGEQTAGRGRLKRTWLAPAGNIALSVVLYPRMAELSSIVMLASLAVVHCIESFAGLKAQIKWPNDVLLNGRKVCGILIETDVRQGEVNHAIVGTGINVDLRPADFAEIESTATSLSVESGIAVSRPGLVRSLLIEMDRLYAVLREGGSLFEEWRNKLVTLGKHVRVTSVEGAQEGIAESVDRDGSLCLRTDDGKLVRIVAGDVTLRG